MTKRIETHMAFIPGEAIQGVLFDFLSDEVAEEVIHANIPLGFYSKNAYSTSASAHDLALRRFKAKTEGAYLPLSPYVTGDYTIYRGEDNTPQNGLDIEVGVDVSDDESISREAQLLGFADSRKLIIARLAIRADQLAEADSHSASIRRLRDVISSPPSPDEKLAEVVFYDTPLTD